MTIGECIAQVDLLRPNAATEREKIAWCWELEAQLRHEFYPRYLPEEPNIPEEPEFPVDPEEGDAPAETEPEPEKPQEDHGPSRATMLTGSGPYEGMYLFYLAAKIDLANQELEAYSLDITVGRQYLDEYRKDYHRTHTPR